MFQTLSSVNPFRQKGKDHRKDQKRKIKVQGRLREKEKKKRKKTVTREKGNRITMI